MTNAKPLRQWRITVSIDGREERFLIREFEDRADLEALEQGRQRGVVVYSATQADEVVSMILEV